MRADSQISLYPRWTELNKNGVRFTSRSRVYLKTTREIVFVNCFHLESIGYRQQFLGLNMINGYVQETEGHDLDRKWFA